MAPPDRRRLPTLVRAPGAAVVALASLVPASAGAQLLSQSELGPEAADPAFELTLEHLAMDSRWAGSRRPGRRAGWRVRRAPAARGPHSPRSTPIGSSRAARRAGIQLATAATPRRSAETPA